MAIPLHIVKYKDISSNHSILSNHMLNVSNGSFTQEVSINNIRKYAMYKSTKKNTWQ